MINFKSVCGGKLTAYSFNLFNTLSADVSGLNVIFYLNNKYIYSTISGSLRV
jgi:hypothetical protein